MRRRVWGVIVGLVLVLVVGGAIVLGVMAVAAWRDRAAERERITREYREVAEAGRDPRVKYAPYAIPDDGVERCLAAVRSAGRAERLYVAVTPEFEVILFRSTDGPGRRLWCVFPNVLRVERPAVDVSDGLDAYEAALLHHYYASLWIKDHADAHVHQRLLWIDGPHPLPGGGWSVESGRSLIAGHGLRSRIASDGALVSIEPVFSGE